MNQSEKTDQLQSARDLSLIDSPPASLMLTLTSPSVTEWEELSPLPATCTWQHTIRLQQEHFCFSLFFAFKLHQLIDRCFIQKNYTFTKLPNAE